MKQTVRLQIFLLFFPVLCLTITANSQKDWGKNVRSEIKGHITKDIEAKIIGIVKPVKERIESLFNEDQSGTYAAYTADMQALSNVKEIKDKLVQAEKLRKKYYPFVKKIWDQAKIDEANYQLQIRNIFPPDVRETIRFGEFLTFTVKSSHHKADPPPAPPPSPNNICIDANTLFAGAKAVGGGGIIGADVHVSLPDIPMIQISTNAIVIGSTWGYGSIMNTAGIPGTFPSDNKQLRAIKSYRWYGVAMAFSVIGCSWSTVAYSSNPGNNFSTDGEIYTAVAPLTFVLKIEAEAIKTEQCMIAKSDIPTLHHGITCYATASASLFLSWGHGFSTATLPRWDICEE